MKKLFIIILLVVLTILGFLTLPWALIFVGIQTLPDPPRPEITYGEFPFRLEYKINGQLKVIEDTVICEYDGIGMNEGVGKFRKWKSRLSSGDEELVLLKFDDLKKLVYPTGSADHYMGDSRYGYDKEFREAVLYDTSENAFSATTIETEELLKEYNIEIIKWNYSEPITNKFIETK